MSSDPNHQQRKAEHVSLALEERHQTSSMNRFDAIRLEHESLPDLDFSDISLHSLRLGRSVPTPFIISGMTGSFEEGARLNDRLASAAARHGWSMVVGSQRQALFKAEARLEWRALRERHPDTDFLCNLGISQLRETPKEAVEALLEDLGASALVIHTNPLQEVLQPEGTPHFRGALAALEKLCASLSVPIILKEVGCGFSLKTLKRLKETGLHAVDLAGAGGTHFGRIEGTRAAHQHPLRARAAETFASWGIPTLDALLTAVALAPPYEIWASGGIRSGLDAAKCVAMGAQTVGFAQRALNYALQGEAALEDWMQRVAFEFKIGLFCTGCASPIELSKERPWSWATI